MEKLQQFKNNPEKISKYNEAVNLLRQVGFDTLLFELASPIPVAPNDPQAMQMNAFANQQRIGYYQAINDFFNITEVTLDDMANANIVKDYGARDKLVEDGRITQQEREELDKDDNLL